ncbi:sugar ABC transporter ATP-binding protein [Alkaliphilus peptidifermentans]|uniref:Monosaccharide ABC transporter ATP-binding protein, CUT2 family (TC 3.A.1.2.-) n=1 Tax=Alkaliphilus peptidifermentans DSM 18978 TaxID=1120976 RepID=A0A1G5ENN5_9FIRM|nr:sugar ABC transporter ATP-binding protein [Alkaliphilus peptidifermentans]SCY28058.1 monosaccharide ABC transporter ATP-binding protein, CUT2 family (TC 3.A.1.2.-) [Alkaliphilus peptidifermentans DSM 18978]
MDRDKIVLEMNNIGKVYYGTRVLKDINLSIKAGEIHAILGENGAGKSTLMNILFGMPVIHSTGGFEGEVLIDGSKVDINSPFKAMKEGIGMVHQEFMLIPGYTITENIKLNREITKPNPISRVLGNKLETLDFVQMDKDAKKAIKSLDIGIDEWTKIAGLPVGYMQFVEIAREIDKENLKILVFDEPTAVLTESEAKNLLQAMKLISDSGIAILFITHRLDEVMEIADNITVLRDGQMVANRKKEETNLVELAQLMVGREIEKVERKVNVDKSSVVMKIKDLKVAMPGEEVKGIDLDIFKGEIIGIGGLAGQGKIGIANGIMGLYPSSGEVVINNDTTLKLNNPKESIAKGLAFVSEDRRGVGLLLDTSIELNIAVTAMQNNDKFLKKYGPFTQLDTTGIRNHALGFKKELDIRCTGVDQITRRLSGGNQQKVCIARALTLEPNILFVSEPTRGIDIGAKKLVLDTLVKLNEELGMTIIMTSSELAELRSVCDRIAIICEGKLEGILKPDDSDADFGLMMAGEYKKLVGEEVSNNE